MTTNLADHAADLVEGDEVPYVPLAALRRRAWQSRQRMEALAQYRWWVMLVVLGGFFSIGLSVTVLSVAVPRIATEFRASEASIAWAVTGPLLGVAVFQPTVGRLGDMFGHKRLYVASFAAETVATALIAISWNAPSLVAFRILGGIVGAAAAPSSVAILMDVFPGPDRVRAMGWWSFVAAGSPVLGVVIGGPIVERLSWRWIFVAQVPLCLAAVVLGAWLLPGLRRGAARTVTGAAPERERFDVKGTVLLAVATASGLLAINRASEWGWTSPFVLACLVAAPIAALIFIRVERSAPAPLLPLSFLRNRNFSAPILVQFFANMAYLGSFLLTPLFLQSALGYTPTRAGLVVIARPLAFSISAPLFGYVAGRLGARFNATLGMVAIVASMGVFAAIRPSTPEIVLYLALSLAGLGLGVSNPSLSTTVADAVPEQNIGIAMASMGMMSTIGGVIGMELMRSFKSFRLAAGVDPVTAYNQAYLGAGLLAGLGIVAALFVVRAGPDSDVDTDPPRNVQPAGNGRARRLPA